MAEAGNARFGFWITVRDRDSARYAVRMSGLPVFLIGVTLAISGAVMLMDPLGAAPAGWAVLVPSAPLIAIGLALRASHAWLAPVACLLFLVALGLEAWMTPSWGLAVRCLIALVALSGLRGWWWLRRHPE